jgi:hypothetical protein
MVGEQLTRPFIPAATGSRDLAGNCGAKGSAPGHLIGFSYSVDGLTYSGEFIGGAMKEGETFSIQYDPDDPAQNDTSMDSTRNKLISIAAAVAGLLLGSLIIWARKK